MFKLSREQQGYDSRDWDLTTPSNTLPLLCDLSRSQQAAGTRERDNTHIYIQSRKWGASTPPRLHFPSPYFLSAGVSRDGLHSYNKHTQTPTPLNASLLPGFLHLKSLEWKLLGILVDCCVAEGQSYTASGTCEEKTSIETHLVYGATETQLIHGLEGDVCNVRLLCLRI